VKFLLAEGMIIVERKLGNGEVLIRCTAPILRNIIIYQIIGPNIDLSKSPKPDNARTIDAKWMLERTIEVDDYSKLFFCCNETMCIHSVYLLSASFHKEPIPPAYIH
jgi:hypothetical protein